MSTHKSNRSSSAYQRRLSREHEKTMALASQASSIKQDISETDKTIKHLQHQLHSASKGNKDLNVSCSELNDKTKKQLERIEYERTKFRQRSALYKARENELLAQISSKDKQIHSLRKEQQLTDLVATRDQAIQEACRQFEESQQHLVQQLECNQKKEAELEEACKKLEAQLHANQAVLKKYEEAGEATEEVVKLFQNILTEKDYLLQREKRRLVELENKAEDASRVYSVLDKELKAVQLLQEEEALKTMQLDDKSLE